MLIFMTVDLLHSTFALAYNAASVKNSINKSLPAGFDFLQIYSAKCKYNSSLDE